jgi:dGTPase
LYDYYTSHIEALPQVYLSAAYKFGADTAVCDYIAGMTDGFAVEAFKELFIPKGWTLY